MYINFFCFIVTVIKDKKFSSLFHDISLRWQTHSILQTDLSFPPLTQMIFFSWRAPSYWGRIKKTLVRIWSLPLLMGIISHIRVISSINLCSLFAETPFPTPHNLMLLSFRDLIEMTFLRKVHEILGKLILNDPRKKYFDLKE